MCGFAGVIAWDERYRCSRETLAKMSAAVAHRGPDGEGFHVNHDEPITPDHPQVSLAFRRLAILDPDPRSMQPFTDGRHWLVFNGEIYNFRELKKELSAIRPDYAWRTTGDTEVLLLSYAVWGEKCVEHLNGMFAFAVWDEVEKALFLARDRMGQKPLYVAPLLKIFEKSINHLLVTNKTPVIAFAFASEINALRTLEFVDTRVSDFELVNYLSWGYTLNSIHRGIGQLNPAFRARIGSSFIRRDNYFTDKRANPIDEPTSPAEQTKKLIRAAVSRQLVSDVPIAAFLSGGVDSSIIAAAATNAMAGGNRLRTFSIGFEDARYDERPYADAIARHLNADHQSFVIKPAADDLQMAAAAFGEPFADSSSIPTMHLAREVGNHVKVALSGDGGDELFGGYDRYRAMRWASHIRKVMPDAFFTVAGSTGNGGGRGHAKSRRRKIGRFIASLAFDDADRYQRFMSLDGQLVNDLMPSVIRRAGNSPHAYQMTFRFAMRAVNDPVLAALSTDRSLYLPYDLLTKVDRCSMLHGLEVRSPFMDHELVQFAAGLTTDQLLKGGPKRMLREAFADDLPAWVFKRKKMGFAVPIGDWFRGPLRGMLRETLFSSHAFGRSHFDMKVVERLVEEHESKRVDHSQRLYALLMLELWWNIARAGVSA